MSYQFLLFDLDHTLFDFDAGEAVALGLLLNDMEFVDHEAFLAYYKPMNQRLWRELENGQITKRELVNTRFAKAFSHFGLQVDGVKVAERFEQYMKEQGQIFKGAEALLSQLALKGYHLYAATNGITAIQKGRLQNSAIGHYFKVVFISEQLGTKKPEPLFYEKIAEQIPNFERSKALMIGDSLTADIQGGYHAGIDTVWYNPTGAVNTSSVQPTYEITNYEALLAVLEMKEEMIGE